MAQTSEHRMPVSTDDVPPRLPSTLRRGLLTVVALTAAALAAAGCARGPHAGPEPPAQGAAPASSEETADERFPVTIAHKYGETEISAAPERVMAVGLTDQDALLAVGVVPVGTVDWLEAYPGAIGPWARDDLDALGGELPTALPPGELDLEAIAALGPDLVVATYSGLSQEEYDTLSSIAPTVAQSGAYVDARRGRR